jgi:hypothetical protein
VPTSFRLNAKGMRDLANGPEVRKVTTTVLRKAEAFAVAISPVDDGDYIRAWETSEEAVTIRGRTRVAGRLANTADHAAAVEWGNSRNGGKGQRVLGRTLAALRRL